MNFTQLFLISISAILIENFVLVKFLGICPFLGVSKKLDTAFGMGLSVIFVMTISSVFTYLAYRFLLVRFDLVYMRTVVFILIIASIVQFTEILLKRFYRSLYNSMGIYLPLITTNCAILGVTILNVDNGYNFVSSVVFGFTAGLGFMLAILIFSGIRARLEFAETPKAFEGVPITLVAASLLALAFMCFQGLKLPI